jgi:hypothetical protein
MPNRTHWSELAAIALVGVLTLLLPAPAPARDDGDQCKAGERFFVRVTDGSLSCANAKRVLNKFMGNVYASNPPCYPGQCRSESPKGWACRLLNTELDEVPGPTAKCERDRDSASAILFFKGESAKSRRTGAREKCALPDVFVSGKLTAHNLACTTARRLLRKFYEEAQELGPDVVVLGFDCHGEIQANGEADIRCRKGARRMHFEGSIS